MWLNLILLSLVCSTATPLASQGQQIFFPDDSRIKSEPEPEPLVEPVEPQLPSERTKPRPAIEPVEPQPPTEPTKLKPAIKPVEPQLPTEPTKPKPAIKPVEPQLPTEPTKPKPVIEPELPNVVEMVEELSLALGSPCYYRTPESNKVEGKCGVFANCPEVLESPFISYCSFSSAEPSVCCPLKEDPEPELPNVVEMVEELSLALGSPCYYRTPESNKVEGKCGVFANCPEVLVSPYISYCSFSSAEPSVCCPLKEASEPELPNVEERVEELSLALGSRCYFRTPESNKVEGKCGVFANCPEVLESPYISYCSFSSAEPSVCCPLKEASETPPGEIEGKVGGDKKADYVLGGDVPALTYFDKCHISPITTGYCTPIQECINDLKLRDQSQPKEWTYCHSDSETLVCCPEFPDVKEDVSAPYLQWKPVENVICGSSDLLPMYVGTIDRLVNHDVYFLNETADRLRSEGYNVKIVKMFGDAIEALTYSNGSKTFTVGFEGPPSIRVVVGGQDATKANAYFMALVGERREDSINWVCDGVVLNREWVLSAAHCFLSWNVRPNVIRLGDYDWKTEVNSEGPTYDFGIDDIFLYPEFDSTQRYHDVVLIKLDRPYPMFAQNINPVCLPWDSDTNLDIVGRHVTLAGWGATEFNGSGSSKNGMLQSVQLQVFNTSVCDDSYSTLLDYRFKWPQGLSRDTMLCAGDMAGGKDACKGDSGAPVTYLNLFDQYILAGIVSTGFGCELDNFPGLYVPMNNPTYLKWIKEVAFKGFLDTNFLMQSHLGCDVI